jgi:WD40 repeat protein
VILTREVHRTLGLCGLMGRFSWYGMMAQVAEQEDGMAEPATPSSGGVFISYRRQETAPYARLLREELSRWLGPQLVFMDVDSIEVGVDFAEAIQRAVDACQVLLALIGPQWLTATDADGQRRLDNPDDTVRLEIEAALARGIRVIPVLVDSTPMPGRHQLPDGLAPLARRNALELSYNRYAYDVGRLLEAVERVMGHDVSPMPAAAGPPPSPPASSPAAAPDGMVPTKPVAATQDDRRPPSDAAGPATGWSGTQLRRFEHPSKWGVLGRNVVFGVAFSPDGRWLATASNDKTARIWEAHSGQQLHSLTHDTRVLMVAFSPDGRRLATGSADATARVWDADSGQQLHLLRHDRVKSVPLSGGVAVAFSPDGRRLATGSDEATARIWDAHSGQQLHGLTHDGAVRAVAFSPDGRWLATGSNDTTGNDNAARIWDADSGQQLHSLSHGGWVTAVAFSPDGRWLATGGGGKTARIWDAHSGRQLHSLAHDEQVNAVAFGPDGRWLATCVVNDKAVRLWDAHTGQLLLTLTHDNWVQAVAVSPDGSWLATGTYGNRAVVWAVTPPARE